MMKRHFTRAHLATRGSTLMSFQTSTPSWFARQHGRPSSGVRTCRGKLVLHDRVHQDCARASVVCCAIHARPASTWLLHRAARESTRESIAVNQDAAPTLLASSLAFGRRFTRAMSVGRFVVAESESVELNEKSTSVVTPGNFVAEVVAS